MYKQRLSWYRVKELATLCQQVCEYNTYAHLMSNWIRADLTLYSIFTDYNNTHDHYIDRLRGYWKEENEIRLVIEYREKKTPNTCTFSLSIDGTKRRDVIDLRYTYISSCTSGTFFSAKSKFTKENWERHYFNRWRKYARDRRGSKEKRIPLMKEIEDFWHKRIREAFQAWFIYHLALSEWSNLIKKL